MEHCTRKPGDEKAIPEFGRDSIEQAMRLRIRDTIEELVKEELDAALGAPKSARVGEQRQGYRHGARERTLTTSLGPTTFAMPRARIQQADGSRTEWRSHTVRRYERRTTRVDEAILGVYLAGGNTRRIKGALAPLLLFPCISASAQSLVPTGLRPLALGWSPQRPTLGRKPPTSPTPTALRHNPVGAALPRWCAHVSPSLRSVLPWEC